MHHHPALRVAVALGTVTLLAAPTVAAGEPTSLSDLQRDAVAEAPAPSIAPVAQPTPPAAPRGGRLRIQTLDGRGFIVVDGHVAAEGVYDDVVPAGDHRIAIVREGYQRLEVMKHVEEASTSSDTFSLVPMPAPPPPATVVAFAAPPVADATRREDRERDRAEPDADREATSGMIKTVSFAGAMQVGSSGSETERSCGTVGSRCSASPSTGGAFMFSLGHMWKYIGFDVLAGATMDGGQRRYVDTGGAPQSYDVERAGGLAAIRLRGQLQSTWFRGSLAVGPGVVYRVVGKSDSFPAIPDDAKTYSSIAFTADLNGQIRVGATTAIAVGAMLWLDNAGNTVTTDGGKFHLTSGAQASLMPYVGFHFGP